MRGRETLLPRRTSKSDLLVGFAEPLGSVAVEVTLPGAEARFRGVSA